MTPELQQQLMFGAIALAVIVIAFILLRGRRKVGPPVFKDPREQLEWALGKTRGGLLDGIRRATVGGKVDEHVIDALEQILLATDIGPKTTTALLEGLKEAYRAGRLKDQKDVVTYLRQELIRRLSGEAKLNEAGKPPTVILVAGVNGVGKTTSIAKLTQFLAEKGKKVMLCPSDTFRAAAIEQLTVWAGRLGVEIQGAKPGQDPASVAHDAHEKAVARGFDYLIVDTAGRQQTHANLMAELGKIARVGKKFIAESPHEALLVIDATTGQNGVRQAAAFKEAVPLTGIILTKLDGTAKGGIVVQIREEFGIPVKFVGMGEQAKDIAVFDAETYVNKLLPLS